MSKTCYVCKYTPIELIEALGGEVEIINNMPENFDGAEQIAHPNLCGFGKALLEKVISADVKELVLVNCCDVIRSVYDILETMGKLDFLYMIDILHSTGTCSIERTCEELKLFAEEYAKFKGTEFSSEKFLNAFKPKDEIEGNHIKVLGGRMGDELFSLVEKTMPYRVENASCVNNRYVDYTDIPKSNNMDELLMWYAGALLSQLPCMRMMDNTGRKKLFLDPGLKGIIYHTVKFCDFYGFEYAALGKLTDVPVLKIESDYTVQSSGQLRTRLEAFAESIETETIGRIKGKMGKGYYGGIDSGSTSTDVVILDKDKNIVSAVIMPTGAGAKAGAQRAYNAALEKAGLHEEDIDAVVTTGYGRTAIEQGDQSITEITCHGKGAHFISPNVHTVIDIGGQDSKVIKLDENGNVTNFVMNDKCAAGTGRFLEMMARTLEMDLEQMSEIGLSYDEDLTISSMCTVFAESEVVSLVAENKKIADIIHGVNKAVAAKTASLVKRVQGESGYMMTGGVSKNKGLVKTLEERIGDKLVISEYSQLCGALGAALFALENSTEH